LTFINNNYGFNNFYIVASGAVDHKKLISLTYKYFLKNFKVISKKRSAFNYKSVSDLYIYKDIHQSHLIIGRATYGYKDEKRTTVNLLSHLLGEGSSSRLFQALREKNGIAYQINTFLNTYYDISSFGVYLSTNDKSFTRARDLICSEFKKLRNKKLSDKELKRVKEYLKGNMLMSLESTTNRMHRIAYSMIYSGRVKTIEESIREIDAVTSRDLLEVANEILDERNLNKVVISSKNHLMQTAA
jgi:predicted Zn-dependent peptidase